MKEFRKLARDFVENKPYDTRATYGRTPEEEDKVNQMIRKMQKENPDIDYTALFDNDKLEGVRQNQHKKAYASYKAFQFLKHGVEMRAQLEGPKKVEDPKKALAARDPYNFPPLQETVAKFLTKDKFVRVLRQGDTLARPGRRFGYTEDDFLEAYFGKDYAKVTSTEIETGSPVFSYNESLKKKYPLDKYNQLPKLLEQR